ncbi:MAG: hypothetical protein U9R05_03685 [Chloroflexota bacterium]|nr:hypothetical protein [Chloroflexota bacterium]
MRRRPFRLRPLRPRPVRPRVPPVVRRALAQAQRLIAAGKFREAAAIYDRLAQEAYARGRLRPGLHMDLEAGRAYLQAADVNQAQERAQRATQNALQIARPGLVMPLVEEITRHLEAQGDPEAAQRFREEIEALLQEQRGAPGGFIGEARRVPRKTLPGHCPACHAPLRPDEVEWLADDRVSCPFCGSVVVAE